MTAEPEHPILFSWISDTAILTTVIVAFVWVVAVAIFAIEPHNKMPDRTTNVLPIRSLPHRPVMQLAFARSQADIEPSSRLTRSRRTRTSRRSERVTTSTPCSSSPPTCCY